MRRLNICAATGLLLGAEASMDILGGAGMGLERFTEDVARESHIEG